MFESVFPVGETRTLEYVITHVFCPLKLPGDPVSEHDDHFLAKAVLATARAYHTSEFLTDAEKARWNGIIGILDHLQASVAPGALDKELVITQLIGMKAGDSLAFLIRAQNTAVIFKRRTQDTLYESYEVSPPADAVLAARGKLIYSYPGPSIAIPNDVFDDPHLRSELANFIVCMHQDRPHADGYITELLAGILRAIGRPADAVRICKRIGDDLQDRWRRSPLWLLIRVVIQTSLMDPAITHDSYKSFMIFFMSRLAEEASNADLSSDFLHFMSAKLSRRLGKLGSSAPNWLSHTTFQTCTRLRGILEDRWKQVQDAQRTIHAWTPPSQRGLIRDTRLSLLSSGEHICSAFANDDPHLPAAAFRSEHLPRGTLDDFLSADGAFFEEAYCREPHVALYDVEHAVEQGLDAWVARATDVEEACVRLEVLADKYLSGAKNTYVNNPELLSVMLLTGIELWIALDKLAIKRVPILADYSPEIPLTILESLLLRNAASFHRRSCAYKYLTNRHSRSCSRPSVFSSTITPDSFAVRYYNESSCLQQLKTRIEHDAKLKFHPWNHFSSPMYEYPIPGELLHAAVIIFELQCPVVFEMWRSITFHVLGHQLFSDQYTGQDVINELVGSCQQSMQDMLPHVIQPDGDGALLSYLVKHPRASISLRLITLRMRGAVRPVAPVALGNVYYHHVSSQAEQTPRNAPLMQAQSHLSHELPSGPYHYLQNYLNSTSHSPNMILAFQAECDPALSLQEFVAFGHLRSGGSLQWLNILRELRSRALTFRRHEVHLLFAQAAAQAGPLTEGECSTWHSELQDPTFCCALLGELGCLTKDVETNWREGMTMATISFLLCRLLASRPGSDISAEALQLLSNVREKTFVWVQELSEKLMDARVQDEHEEHRWLLLDAAAVCRSTFDVISLEAIRGVPSALHDFFCSSRSIEILLSCAILIRDNVPSDYLTIPAQTRLLLDRDRRLSLALEDMLKDAMKDDPLDDGIDRAICRLRSAYRRGPKNWKPLEPPNSRWLMCETMPNGNQRSQTVHLNLLDGTVLVDGKRLGTLPKAITEHPTYSLIFGKQMFNVIQSDLLRTDFLTQHVICGHQVYFALRNGDLIIRAKHQDHTDTFELIPQEKLRTDLPLVLVEGHAHWLNVSAAKPIIEIRSLSNIWKSSSENWMIDCTPGQYHMHKGHQSLIDIRSPSCAMVSSLFEALDVPEHLIVTVTVAPLGFSQSTVSESPPARMSVLLPRYGLSFFVDEEGDLQSSNIRGMVYDQDQSIGTMFGLVNRLVLRPKVQIADEIYHRRVLIPDGNVSFKRQGHHVYVEISTPRSPLHQITYQTYTVDLELGCLTGNVGLTNQLYLAYLHAVTSNGCCTDPLTGRTGTEEALWMLRSASCQSILKLGPREAEILCSIALLWPRPLILGSNRQTAKWLDIPVNSQSPMLYAAAKEIRERFEKVQLLFHEDPHWCTRLFARFPHCEDHIIQRSLSRAACLAPLEFAGDHTARTRWDTRFTNLGNSRWRDQVAYKTASAVYHWSINGELIKNLPKLSLRLPRMTPTQGNSTSTTLQYNRTWLWQDRPSASSWIHAYNLFQHSQKDNHQFQLLFTLPSLAIGDSSLSAFAQTLLAVAIYPELRSTDGHPIPGDETTIRKHLTHIQHVLNKIQVPTPSRSLPYTRYTYRPSLKMSSRRQWSIGVDKLLSKRAPPPFELPDKPPQHARSQGTSTTSPPDHDTLHQLITNVQENATNLFQRQYACSLRTSSSHIRDSSADVATDHLAVDKCTIKNYYIQCRRSFLEARDYLKEQLRPETDSEKALDLAGLWPRVTTNALFRCLASTSPINLSEDWKGSLISFALLALEFQRARRLLRLALDNLHSEFSKELQNEGCDGWSTKDHPDWLLIQLQGNFLVRRVQADIAKEMMTPHSGNNTVMQLNMGEGKSSVIVPISAAALANGNQLVRVIVPKALTSQMFQLLVGRLSGFTNRRIYYLPFSRSLPLDTGRIVSLFELFGECMREHGILVAQPEHVLSLRLTSIERQMASTEQQLREEDTRESLDRLTSTRHFATVEEKWMDIEETWISMEEKWMHIDGRCVHAGERMDMEERQARTNDQRTHAQEQWRQMVKERLHLEEQWTHLDEHWNRAVRMRQLTTWVSLSTIAMWMTGTKEELTAMKEQSTRMEEQFIRVEKQKTHTEAERMSLEESRTRVDAQRARMKDQRTRMTDRQSDMIKARKFLRELWNDIEKTNTAREVQVKNTNPPSLIGERVMGPEEQLEITEVRLTRIQEELGGIQEKVMSMSREWNFRNKQRVKMRDRWGEMKVMWRRMEQEREDMDSSQITSGLKGRIQKVWNLGSDRTNSPGNALPPPSRRKVAIQVRPPHPLLELQRWLHEHARDILDECDEILHVRFQLVYTTGRQRDMEGVPARWTTTQQVLRFVKRRASTLAKLFPLETEYEGGTPGSFPHIRIQQTAAAHQLVSWLSEDVMSRLLPIFTSFHVHSGLWDAVRVFISSTDVPLPTAKMVEEHFRGPGKALWSQILLLRGLLANGILLFALQERRWRVDYGLAPTRSMLAVPYRAKDTPAPQAEYGHPDVVILLTCLSYYYGGLTEAQLRVAFETLLKLDDPTPDYALWVQECTSIPDSLHNVSAVNLMSTEQWRQYLFPLFARNQATVDFYLSTVVFPKEAKEFPSKLSGSSWDLAERRNHFVTGFSGTNDGRYLLPMSISQSDPEHQRGTNAKVLAYLLQEKNSSYQPMADKHGQQWTTLEFIKKLIAQEHEIRVLLDVGAQILDLENHQLAKTWLSLHSDALAVIYFNDDDELTVLTRECTREPLFSSPFAQQLDQCIAYLDHAHTRGTDIKFPNGFRAAVTLGPKVTKDNLVQGCMRMRMLGHGHSVMFFAPFEVDRKIRSATGKRTSDDTITTTDILQWVICETCNNIQQWAPHWAQQGMDFITRHDAWSRFCRDGLAPDGLFQHWLQPEAKSLVELYAPRTPQTITSLFPEIHQHCVELGFSLSGNTAADEEQEREIIYEKVPVDQQKPPPPRAYPAIHSIHRDVVTFVRTGIIPLHTKAFRPIFSTLSSTPAATGESLIWSQAVLATKDFCRTIVGAKGRAANYLRPVHWVVSGSASPGDSSKVLVVFSPFEVNELITMIRDSKNVHLHLYTPRTVKSMKSCDDLQLCSIPPVPREWNPPWQLIDQLNVFAGQLYFRDYDAYKRLCRFLCIYTEDMRNDNNAVVQPDGFIPPKKRSLSLVGQSCKRFQRSPLPSLRVLIGLRIKGRGFIETQMGSILEGRTVTQRDFEPETSVLTVA